MKSSVRLLGFLLVTVCLCGPVVADAPSSWGGLQPGPHEVGFRLSEDRDSSRSIRIEGTGVRPRPLRIYVWYPAAVASGARPMTFGRYAALASEDVWSDAILPEVRKRTAFARRPLARSLEPKRLEALLRQPVGAVEDAGSAPGAFPLVVVGQGLYYESPITHAILGEFLASHGFVVATCPLVGTHSPRVHLDVTDLETHVRDLEFVVARVRGLSFVDPERLGLLGFDMGGMSSLILAMRNPDVDALVTMDAGVLFAHPTAIPSGIRQSSPHYDVSSLRVPWMHATQSMFGTRIEGQEGESLFDTAVHSDRYLVLVDDVGHVDFTSYALIEDRKPVPGYWGPPRDGANESYETVCLHVSQFLAAYLAGDGPSRDLLARLAEADDPAAKLSVEHRAPVAPRPTHSDFVNALLAGKIDEGLAMARDLSKTSSRAEFEPVMLSRLGSHLIVTWELVREGIAVLELNVELHPRAPAAWASLGEGQLMRGDIDAAILSFRKSLELDPKNADVQGILEWAESRQDSQPSIRGN
jgi:pimeloyl-ACP methyl ester carboxylesterase